jgi:DNA end-binding protein Ku
MRTIWNGSISFGLVNIPSGWPWPPSRLPAVGRVVPDAPPRVRDADQEQALVPEHDREVSNDEIVKGWEVAKGQFVFVEDSDLEALETADDSRTIAITRFVELDQVDPIYFDRTYFLAPADAVAQRRPYVLLLEAMKETNTAAVGKFVRQGAEHFCLIRPKGTRLRSRPSSSPRTFAPRRDRRGGRGDRRQEAELELARQVIGSLAADFDPRSS